MAVLITGGSKGVGLAIAKRLAEPGRDILINYLRDDDSANIHPCLPPKAPSRRLPENPGARVVASLARCTPKLGRPPAAIAIRDFAARWRSLFDHLAWGSRCVWSQCSMSSAR